MSLLLDDDLGLLDVISPHSSSSAPSSPTLSPIWKPSSDTNIKQTSPLSISSHSTDDDDLFITNNIPTLTRLPSLTIKTDVASSMICDDDILYQTSLSRLITTDSVTSNHMDMMERGGYEHMMNTQHHDVMNALDINGPILPAFQYGWPEMAGTTTTTIPIETETLIQSHEPIQDVPIQSIIPSSHVYTAPVPTIPESIPAPISSVATTKRTRSRKSSSPTATTTIATSMPTSPIASTLPPILSTPLPELFPVRTRRTRLTPVTPTTISVVVDPLPTVEQQQSQPTHERRSSIPIPTSPLAGSRRARKRNKQVGSRKTSTTPSKSTSRSPSRETTTTTTVGKKRKKSSTSVKKENMSDEDGCDDDDQSVDSKNGSGVDKKQQRLERNRASAQLSRERRKNYMSQLEDQLRELSDINKSLTKQVDALDSENQNLKKMIANKKANPGTSSPPSETGAARSALVLFAVVLSFGLFFHIAGLNHINEPVGIRVSSPSILTPTPGPIPTTLHGRSRILMDVDTTSDKALVKIEDTTTTTDTNARALVPVVKQEVMNGEELGKALDVYKKESTSTTTTPTAVTEPVTATATPIEDPLLAYEKLLAGTNFTRDSDAAYMFCPTALQMHINPIVGNTTIHTNYTPTATATTMTSSDLDSKRFQLVDDDARRSRERSDRLRRVMGMSSDEKSSVPMVPYNPSHSKHLMPRRSTIPSYASIGADAAKMYLSSRSDRLLLWVPIRALKPQWEYNHTMADSTDSGLVEIDCRIDDIRPLLLA